MTHLKKTMVDLSLTDLIMVRSSLRVRILDIEDGFYWRGLSVEEKTELVNRYNCLISKIDDFISNKSVNSSINFFLCSKVTS